MRTAAIVLSGVLGSSSFLLACGDAPLTVNGGEPLFDSGAMMASGDGGSTAEGGGMMLPAGCETGGAMAGSTFTDLYACYFGPMGVASCSAFSTCHVSGGIGGGFWTCGDNQATCQMGLTGGNGAAVTSVPAGGVSDWTTTPLYANLHSVANMAGTMPLSMDLGSSTYTFTTDDLSRIQAWVQGGAGP